MSQHHWPTSGRKKTRARMVVEGLICPFGIGPRDLGRYVQIWKVAKKGRKASFGKLVDPFLPPKLGVFGTSHPNGKCPMVSVVSQPTVHWHEARYPSWADTPRVEGFQSFEFLCYEGCSVKPPIDGFSPTPLFRPPVEACSRFSGERWTLLGTHVPAISREAPLSEGKGDGSCGGGVDCLEPSRASSL